MLSSKTILSTIAAQQAVPGQMRGKVEFLHRDGQRRASRLQGHSSTQLAWIDDMGALYAGPPVERSSYAHPERDLSARHTPYGDRSASLSPTDLAWLNRLPSDPAQVSYQDAVELASLAASLGPSANPSDLRLIQSIWMPVKELHDARAARVELQNAAIPIPNAPSSTLSALAEAVQAEVPQLGPSEAMGRAQTMLDDVLAERNAARDDQILRAQATIAAADQASQTRTAVTRA